jgi:hypothetical protein
MSEPVAGKLRSLLGSDVYTQKGRLRSDDAAARLRELISQWRADRVPPSTREQPFPPAEVMEPIRRAERLCRAIDDLSTTVGGLPVLSQDRVWDRVRGVGLDELLQFDWTLVGESDALATATADCGALDQLDTGALEERLGRIRETITDRRRYLEILA